MEKKQKIVLALIVIAVLLGASVFAYYTFYYSKDDKPNGNVGDDDVADDDVSDDDVGDDDDDYIPPDRPRAVIEAPTQAYQFYEVTFDARSSSDPNGLTLTYSWDFITDMELEEDADTALASYIYEELGEFLVTLAVQNTDGGTDTESITITIVPGTGNPEYENLTLDEGNDGNIYKKAVGDSDVIKHWTMPEDIIKVEATLYWTEPDWELRFSLGTGDSPDAGTVLVDDSADSGPLVITYFNNDDSTLTTGQWFIRIGILNDEKHQPVIEQCDYNIGLKIYYVTPDDF